MSLHFDVQKKLNKRQDLARLGLGDVRLFDTLSAFDPYGAWRLDIEDGLAYWSEGAFEIHGLPYREDPVDYCTAIEAYHPQDREHLLNCLQEAVKRNSGFRFVLRLKPNGPADSFVKATGRYRVNQQGREELYGTFSSVQPLVRSVLIGP